jgi:hypothetical protein
MRGDSDSSDSDDNHNVTKKVPNTKSELPFIKSQSLLAKQKPSVKSRKKKGSGPFTLTSREHHHHNLEKLQNTTSVGQYHPLYKQIDRAPISCTVDSKKRHDKQSRSPKTNASKEQ